MFFFIVMWLAYPDIIEEKTSLRGYDRPIPIGGTIDKAQESVKAYSFTNKDAYAKAKIIYDETMDYYRFTLCFEYIFQNYG